MEWNKDIFICHASEDKDSVVRPLYTDLERAGFDIWYDEAEIKWGDSITQKVNWGLVHSRYVIVVLSQSFVDKKWPNREFDSVMNIESSTGEVRILPLVVGSPDFVSSYYPLINDKLYLSWSGDTVKIVDALRRLIPSKAGVHATESSAPLRSPLTPPSALHSFSEVKVQRHATFRLDDKLFSGQFIRCASVGGLPIDFDLNSLSHSVFNIAYMLRFLGSCVFSQDYFSYGKSKFFIETPDAFSKYPGMSDLLLALLASQNINYSNVVILFPETLFTSDPDHVIAGSNFLTSRGIQCGVSKFGTGYSSFFNLNSIPLSYIFVSSDLFETLSPDSTDFQLMDAIRKLSASLNCVSAVEGVVDADAQRVLSSIGFDLFTCIA
ncbi:MAG TPA: hypothetical protein DEP32_10100 [Pseudomonas sp.]|nr:hypothetical protein [Pseudomonas sp.]MBB50910.1 hypothetical protein [Pseudomonadales bacterium]MBF76793.1 hypothetical protein [Pseudomonadales bacterium]MBU30827.1 hypothetical protein [Pseudomonadales bacterium]HCA24504.1 hypothetical protein [Pseudomonas sp.]|tara:strand:+ start:505 stop:1644 length:1140 start_codon:yes stop_codon:yes gene_type:complete